MNEIIECVVNISEGRRQSVIDSISYAIQSVGNTTLIHVDSGIDANRTVFTFFTDLRSLRQTILSLYECALSQINMVYHEGKHPRIGVVDVCPFIPVTGITKETLIPIIDNLAKEIGQQFLIPVYLYEDSSASQIKLESIRKEEYESLQKRKRLHDNLPDYGSFINAKTSGATIVGVRSFLLAYNINLNTADVSIAKTIAKKIRGSGYRTPKGKILGQFPSVKAIGWYIEEYGFAQVSTNITAYHDCCFHHVYESCKKLAKQLGAEVTGSELIGLTPKEALVISANYYRKELTNEDKQIDTAITCLGLNQLSPFLKEDRIIEYVLNDSNPAST